MTNVSGIRPSDVSVPAMVPMDQRDTYITNFLAITRGTGRLMLFAGDQKIEHLNDDFYGESISEEDGDPEHLFKIASGATIGCFAAQFGLISKYGLRYPAVPYLVKLNSKTHLIKKEQRDPLSRSLTDVADVVRLRKRSGLRILGVGYTIYFGSEFEDIMLREAAKIVVEAHTNGLLAVIWAYPRGKAVRDEKDAHLIAGATGAAACLGADFVKISPPKKDGVADPSLLREATRAAGMTRVVCAGGSSDDPIAFFQRLHDQIHMGGTCGNATGRNIHQKSLREAIKMCNAISAITFEGKTVEEAVKVYQGDR